MNTIQNLIKNICDEEEIHFQLVSKNWIMILEKDGITKFVAGYKFGLNDHALGLVCDDKYAIYDVLNAFHLPVCEYFIVFHNYDPKKIQEYASKYQYHMVVKVNEGTCGNDMYQVYSEEEMFQRIDELLIKSYSISICPFYEIKNEYRSIIYHDSIELFYGKRRPVVVGDGVKTIYELLLEFNPHYFSKMIDHSDLDVVLEKGSAYSYGWQHNLSKGAMPFYVEDSDIKTCVQELAMKVAKKLDLKFASVDIVELENGDIKVMEVNSGVMMDNFMKTMEGGEEVTKEIYRKVLLDLFKEK